MRLFRARRWLEGRMPQSRRALVVGCALVLIGCATAATPAAPALAGDAAAVEARVLADRILQEESDDLLLDGKRQRALSDEIKRALSLIRRTHPAMAEITVRESRRPGTLVLGLEGVLRDAVFAAWEDESASAPPGTGQAAFDALNRGLGLRAVQPFSALASVVLYLHKRANIAAAMRAYRAIDGVAYVEPDASLGDGSDIEAAKVQGRWYFVFRRAWGDCPSGCIDQELFFFTVVDGEAALVEPAQGRGMESFAALVANRGWR